MAATETTHYHLLKPAGSDAASISVINNNMDLIDAAIYGVLTKIYPVGSIYITMKNENPGTTLGFGNWESARELDELNKQRAKEENEALQTQNVEPEEVDDDDIHIAEHSKALLGREFDYTPEAKARLITHIRVHKRRKALIQSLEHSAQAQ